MKQPCVYMLAKRYHGTIYVGSTTDLKQRLQAHRSGSLPGFTREHGISLLVWFEHAGTIEEMAHREKLIKRWKREFKYNLIERRNPRWDDLSIEIDHLT